MTYISDHKFYNRFITSDLHLGHRKLAELRGFRDEFHFWEEFKLAWNSVVQEHNVGYILGDVVMYKSWLDKLTELNGTKRIVIGNHDIFWTDYLTMPRVKANAMEIYPKQGLVLTHIPVHESYFSFNKAKWRNMHGHMHSCTLPSKKYINVCIEQIGLKPVKLSNLLNYTPVD